MLTKELIKSAINGEETIQYDWNRSFTSKTSYDLFLTIGNCGYRVASYSIKTKRLIIHFPCIHIPSSYALEQFIEYVNKKENII